MAEAITVETVLAKGVALREEQIALLAKVDANRQLARQLVALDMASPEQAKAITEMYPFRTLSEESKAKRAAKRAAKTAAENAAERKAATAAKG